MDYYAYVRVSGDQFDAEAFNASLPDELKGTTFRPKREFDGSLPLPLWQSRRANRRYNEDGYIGDEIERMLVSLDAELSRLSGVDICLEIVGKASPEVCGFDLSPRAIGILARWSASLDADLYGG